MVYDRPKRETVAAWKAIICWFAGHDWGMFWNGKDGYNDICVRCGKVK